MQAALVSREVYPFGGGGIGEYINACAHLLSREGEVTIFTSDAHRTRYRALKAEKDSRLVPNAQVVFVPEPSEADVGGYFSTLHLYSSRILDALRQHYGSRGPDLVEFSDYQGEGAVTAQARRAGDPFLRRSLVAIRLHTSAEICAVLDGFVDDSFPARITCELERLALRDADYVLWPGGDTYPFYQRFYQGEQLAPGRRVRNPFMHAGRDLSQESSATSDDALRLLYLGRLERRKGIHNLVRAFSYIDHEELCLDILGGDTDTAPLGTPMRSQLEMMAAGDPRITFLEPVDRTQLADAIRAHDSIVLPSLWEAWPYVGLETLRLGRPIIATPVGGFTEIVRPGASGWLSADTTSESLVALLEHLLVAREERDALRRGNLPCGVFRELTDADEILQAYKELLVTPGRWGIPSAGPYPDRDRSATAPRRTGRASTPARTRGASLVSIIIPYYRLDAHIEEAVRSAIEQTHGEIEVILVNDGSMRDADWVLGEVAARYPIMVVTQVNSGLGAARNFGISQARGRFVVPLDADNVLETTFIERALSAFEVDSQAAYVTSWSRYIDEDGSDLPLPNIGYQPLGNASREVLRNNVGGDATALLPVELFELGFSYSEELTSYEDWQLYQQLHVDGRYGIVIPERLLRYRLREDSMIRQFGVPNQGRLAGELAAHLRERELQWMSSSG
jgi:glycosyltransferase involved in cell wall biosynthesis